MHFKFRHIEKIVGGFFLLTCTIVVILLVIVARGQRWFQQYTPYVCYFARGGGLHAGSVVMIHGLEAGRIKGIALSPDNRVRMDVDIFRQYADRIRAESLARLSDPLIGSSTLEIIPGAQDRPPLPVGATIPSEEVSAQDLDTLIASATDLVHDLDDPEGDLKKALGNINRASHDLSSSLAKKDGTLRQIIERRELYDKLVSATTHLDRVLSAIDEKSPDIQDAVTEARRGLEEAGKVIRAMQKSIFLRGNVEQYLKEDSALRSEGRAP